MEHDSVRDGNDHVDEETLAEIFVVLADETPEALLSVCELFRSGVPRRIAEIDAALAERRFDDAAGVAHSLRGSAGAFGARRLSDLGLRLEQGCRASDADAAALDLGEIRAEFPVFRAILDARLAGLSRRRPTTGAA